ncbi:MAG: NAD(P)-binding domain-containing protein [Acidimicrobiales bacterium]
MTVIAIGLNHRSPLEVLEGIAIPADGMSKALTAITSSEFVNEAVVLSTCNRTEVYIHGERFHDAYHDVRDALDAVGPRRRHLRRSPLRALPRRSSSPSLHRHRRTRFRRARRARDPRAGQDRMGDRPPRGHGGHVADGQLFEHAIACGKRVRTDTGIGRSTASLSHAAVSLVTERLGSLDGKRILLVGAGEVGAGVATALAKSANLQVEVTNRTAAKANDVANAVGAVAVDWSELTAAMTRADVVITATAAPGNVISLDQVRTATDDRSAPTLLLDLAVPATSKPASPNSISANCWCSPTSRRSPTAGWRSDRRKPPRPERSSRKTSSATPTPLLPARSRR